MKAYLMYSSRDFDLEQELPALSRDLMQDLELQTLFGAMARDDEFLLKVAKQTVLSGLDNDLDTILYRQPILKDCLNNPAMVREMYTIAVEAIEKERKHYWGILRDYPPATLSRAIEVLQLFMDQLKKLRMFADTYARQCESEGFTRFFVMLQQELTNEYFAEIRRHLRELKFPDGVLVSAELGQGNKGKNYILRKPPEKEPNWLKRVLATKPREYTFTIADRDESGAKALTELQGQGINLAANALAQSADHTLSFFKLLRAELGFYVGCLNLHERLAEKGEPICFPVPMARQERSESKRFQHSVRGLYDVCLTLRIEPRVVGNTVNADEKSLVIITGANQGGKSTFLRSIGLAQVMMQCGMFVPAEAFCANVCNGVFTHYKREEDATMQSGKFDEELKRMSEIVDHIATNSLLLCNESFAATNEREGSEIAKQIVCALREKGIKIFYVTHLYEFARGFYAQEMRDAIYLRAERQVDGTRTFRVKEGEPLQTSYGKDLYERIFVTDK